MFLRHADYSLLPELLRFGAKSRHLVLLVRLADQRTALGVFVANLLDRACYLLAVQCIVDGEAQAGALFDNPLPQLIALLTNAAGENQCIHVAIKCDKVGANESAYSIDKDVEGKLVSRLV